MAENETQKRSAVYRSVSFKKLQSWKSNERTEDQPYRAEDLGSLALPPPATLPLPLPVSVPVDVDVDVARRKVSKISAASLNLSRPDPKRRHCASSSPSSSPSLSSAPSPNVRQLSEKFGANASSDGVSAGASGPSSSPRIGASDEGQSHDESKEFVHVNSPAERSTEKRCHSGQESGSVSGSDSDFGQRYRVRKSGATPGKRSF